MYTHYYKNRIEKYGNDSEPSVNELLIENYLNEMRTAPEYKGKYEFSDVNGVCIGEINKIPDYAKVFIDISTYNLLDAGIYSGAILDGIGTLLAFTKVLELVALATLMTLVGAGVDNELSGTDPEWLASLLVDNKWM